MKKILGYIIAAVGILGIATYSIPELKKVLQIPTQINDTMLITISLIVAAIGIFFVVKGKVSSKQPREVPIFHGKNVVGYRRH